MFETQTLVGAAENRQTDPNWALTSERRRYDIFRDNPAPHRGINGPVLAFKRVINKPFEKEFWLHIFLCQKSWAKSKSGKLTVGGLYQDCPHKIHEAVCNLQRSSAQFWASKASLGPVSRLQIHSFNEAGLGRPAMLNLNKSVCRGTPTVIVCSLEKFPAARILECAQSSTETRWILWKNKAKVQQNLCSRKLTARYQKQSGLLRLWRC